MDSKSESGPTHSSHRNSEVSDVIKEVRYQAKPVSSLEKISDASDADYEELI